MAMAYNGLAKLIEELGELQQVTGKILAYPEMGNHPDGRGHLDTRFVEEIGDVAAAILFVQVTLLGDENAAKNFFQSNPRPEEVDATKEVQSRIVEDMSAIGWLVGNATGSASLLILKNDEDIKNRLRLNLSRLLRKAVETPLVSRSSRVFHGRVRDKLMRYFEWHLEG